MNAASIEDLRRLAARRLPRAIFDFIDGGAQDEACMIGRPFLYGLAAGGGAGVGKALEILRSEIDVSLALLG